MAKSTRKKSDEIQNLPFAEEAEKGCLGCAIQQKAALSRLVEKCDERDFFNPSNREIFEQLSMIYNAQKEIDCITFTQHLRDFMLLETVGGVSYVTELATLNAPMAMLDNYIQILKDKTLLRTVITSCSEAITKSRLEQAEVDTTLAEIQLSLGGLKSFQFVEERTLADEVDDKVERMQTGTPDAHIIRTWIKELDHYSPLCIGDMPLIVGERKSGKSILALSIMENICISQKRPGVYFSLEDRKPKVVDRIFAGVSKIPMHRHHVSKMTEEEITKAADAALKIRSSGLIVHDDAFDLSVIVSIAMQELVRHHDLAVICIDYAQLIRTPETKRETNRQEDVASISRTFRRLSMETGVPIILLSQLNEKGSTRESRALEQDATACWQISAPDEEKPNSRSITIPYQRNGESGVSFPITFRGEIARVENFAAAPKLETEKRPSTPTRNHSPGTLQFDKR